MKTKPGMYTPREAGAIFLFAGLYLAFAPLAIIWSLNILFGLGIAYTWKTWAGVVMLWMLSKPLPRDPK